VKWVHYAVVAPKWRARGKPLPSLGTRPRLRWQVVREVRPVMHDDGIIVSSTEHVSFHWTRKAANKAAWMDNLVRRIVYGQEAT